MKQTTHRFIALLLAIVMLTTISPIGLMDSLSPIESVDETSVPSNPTIVLDPAPFNLTNDYQKIWEPNNIRGSTHAVDASPSKDLVATAGGWLSDTEVHVYRWDPDTSQYYHVESLGDGIFQGDVLDVKFMDADNNGRLEIVAGCADGTIYVFEALSVEDGVFSVYNSANFFDLVWNSSTIIDRQIWQIEVADIDHDAQTEIIAGAWDSKVYVFDYVDHSAWPYCSYHWMDFEYVWDSGDTISGRVNSVAVGDADADGLTEIYAGSQDCKVYRFEEIPCLKHTYVYRWDSGDSIYRPINSITISNNIDNDVFGELVVSAYGQGVFIFHYDDSIDDFTIRKINQQLATWEQGVVPTTGVYSGYEADPYADKKIYGWNPQGIYELDTYPYPWNNTYLGGDSALGGPPDHALTTFDATGPYQYLGEWVYPVGTDLNEFGFVGALTVDVDGFTYVCDANTDVIKKIDVFGEVILQWGGTGSNVSELDTPLGIAIGIDGCVYVSDAYNHRIQKFTAEGTFITAWGENGTEPGQFQIPYGIDVDSNGSVYVADALNNRIQKFTSDGEFITAWGTLGTGDGELNTPYDVAVNDEFVVVSDHENDRLQIFTHCGEFIREMGGAADIDLPAGLDIDPDGFIYVADFEYDQVVKFTKYGEIIDKIGVPGIGPLEFSNPYSIEITETGILVSDTSNNRIQKVGYLTVENDVLSSLDPFYNLGGIVDVATSPEGYIYVSDLSNDSVIKYDYEGNYVRSWEVPSDIGGEPADIYGIGTDIDGNVYVCDYDRDIVQKFSSTGTLLDEIGSGYLSYPYDVTIDEAGYIYVSDYFGNRIGVFNPSGTYVRTIGSSGSGFGYLSSPGGITIGTDGLLYVCDIGNSRVHSFETDGTPIDEWPVGYTAAFWIASSPDGYLYTSGNDDAVHVHTLSGHEVMSIPSNIGPDSELISPYGLSIDSSGNLFVVDYTSHTIWGFSSAYSYTFKATAIVDFGEWEELGGDSTASTDLVVYSPLAEVNIDLMSISISNDSETYIPIERNNTYSDFMTLVGYGGTYLYFVNVDDALREAQWQKYRYAKFELTGGVVYQLDAIWGRVAKPIDTAMVVTTGHVNVSSIDDGYEEIIIGTVDGQIMAYDAYGTMVWQSQSDIPHFSLDSSIRDIVQLDGRGIMPTWDYDTSLLTSMQMVTMGYTFERFQSFCFVDLEGSDAKDLVITFIDGSDSSHLLYFENTGTDENPVWNDDDLYFSSRIADAITVFSNVVYATVNFENLDGDNDLDMIITTMKAGDQPSFEILYLENDGSNYWTHDSSQMIGPDTAIANGNSTARVSFHDMDKDGDLDMFVSSDKLYYFELNVFSGDLYWDEEPEFVEGINDAMREIEITGKVAISDFDYDGDYDITITHGYENYTSDFLQPNMSRISYFENTGSFTVPTWVKQRSMFDPDFRGSGLTPEDGYTHPYYFNPDGDDITDLYLLQDSNIVRYDGVIQHDSFMVATYPYIHLVEVDKVSTHDGYEAYDSWDNHRDFEPWSYSVEFDDTDEDGRNEIIVGSFDCNIYTFEQVANNTYRRAWRSPDLIQGVSIGTGDGDIWEHVTDMAIGDQDRDGKKEIIAVAGPQFFVFENVEDNHYELVFQSSPILLQGEVPSHVGAGTTLMELSHLALDEDLDKDGTSEIVVAGTSYLVVFENAGDDNYVFAWWAAHQQAEAGQAMIQDIITGDFDNDEFREILVAVNDNDYDESETIIYEYGWLTIWENQANADGEHLNNSFIRSYNRSIDDAVYALAAGDNSGNGLEEFYVGGEYGVHIFESIGNDDYLIQRTLYTHNSVTAVEIANTDGDSYFECIVGNGKFVSVYEQDVGYPGFSHQYQMMWNSSELHQSITDIVVGDSNHNYRNEIVITAKGGYLYSYEWLFNVTESGPTALLAQTSIEESQMNNDSVYLIILDDIRRPWEIRWLPVMEQEVL
ncbi:MAG: putative Peptidylamidoglycolate lyase [Candidatus Thorarchaeota archaeon]|nr:MAG: putative Peptidylamidoglycolate lyase [Candidatus Thorarchaeota archaeon]